jgi:hypothetical protein
LLGFSARSRWPDGSNAASPLNCCRGGVADYSSWVNVAGISSSGPVFSSSLLSKMARLSMSNVAALVSLYTFWGVSADIFAYGLLTALQSGRPWKRKRFRRFF